jgi:hypothetical protein
MLERPANDKHSSIIRTLINYDRKKFITLGPGLIFTVTPGAYLRQKHLKDAPIG